MRVPKKAIDVDDSRPSEWDDRFELLKNASGHVYYDGYYVALRKLSPADVRRVMKKVLKKNGI